MIVILGLVILVAAVIVGVAGVLANGGHAHAVTHFAVFGYHVTGSTGTLFLSGIVVGALALAGLSLLLAGARRTSRRGRDARRGLGQSRRAPPPPPARPAPPAAGGRSPAARPPPSARTATTCATSATPPAPTPPAPWATTASPRTAASRTAPPAPTRPTRWATAA